MTGSEDLAGAGEGAGLWRGVLGGGCDLGVDAPFAGLYAFAGLCGGGF